MNPTTLIEATSRAHVPIGVAAQVAKIVLNRWRPQIVRLVIDSVFDIEPEGLRRMADRLRAIASGYRQKGALGRFRDPLVGVQLDPLNAEDFDVFVCLAPYSIDAAAWIETPYGERQIYESVDCSSPVSFVLPQDDWERTKKEIGATAEEWFTTAPASTTDS